VSPTWANEESRQSGGRSSSWMPTELRWLSEQIRPLLHWHLGSFLCFTVGSLLGILTPLVLKWVIDQIIPGRQTGLLLIAGALIFLSAQGRTAGTNLGSYLILTAAQRMSLKLRMSLLRHLDSLSADYYEGTPTGAVIYPLREPLEEIAYFGSDLVPAILRTLLTTGFTVATMFTLSPALTLAVLPFIPAFLITRQHFRKKLAAESDIAQCHRVSWSNFLEEHVASVIPIQSLWQQRRQERRGSGSWLGRFGLSNSLSGQGLVHAVHFPGGRSGHVRRHRLRRLEGSCLYPEPGEFGGVLQLRNPALRSPEWRRGTLLQSAETFASVRQVQTVLAVRPSVVSALARSQSRGQVLRR